MPAKGLNQTKYIVLKTVNDSLCEFESRNGRISYFNILLQQIQVNHYFAFCWTVVKSFIWNFGVQKLGAPINFDPYPKLFASSSLQIVRKLDLDSAYLVADQVQH